MGKYITIKAVGGTLVGQMEELSMGKMKEKGMDEQQKSEAWDTLDCLITKHELKELGNVEACCGERCQCAGHEDAKSEVGSVEALRADKAEEVVTEIEMKDVPQA